MKASRGLESKSFCCCVLGQVNDSMFTCRQEHAGKGETLMKQEEGTARGTSWTGQEGQPRCAQTQENLTLRL